MYTLELPNFTTLLQKKRRKQFLEKSTKYESKSSVQAVPLSLKLFKVGEICV